MARLQGVAGRIAIVAIAALVLAGCGGSSRKDDEKQIAATLKTFFRDLADGDAAGACGALTAHGRETLFQAKTPAACEATVKKVTSRSGAAAIRTRRELRGARILTVVWKTDDRANVDVQLPSSNAPTAPFQVLRRGDGWAINGPVTPA